MEKRRLVEYAMMSAIYIATTVMALHPEVQANKQPVETHPATVMPENLPQRYRASRFLSFQPVEVETKTPPARLAGIIEPSPIVLTPKFTPADTMQALTNASFLVRCAVDVEVAGVGYNPYAQGREGELGIGQLHPKGKLLTFYKNGYTDPFDPYQVVAFMIEQFALGDGNHWAGIRDGICR